MTEAATENLVRLVAGLQAGEESAWREYIRAHGRLMIAAGRRVGIRGTDLEEIVQITSVEACRSIGSLREPARLASWTYQIAFRAAVKLRRRRGPESAADGLLEGDFLATIAGEGPSPEDVAIRLEQEQWVREGFDRLEPPCRRLLEALYLETPPLGYNEVSARLQMPIGSIGPTRARCLEKLKKALSPVSRRSDGATTKRGPTGKSGPRG